MNTEIEKIVNEKLLNDIDIIVEYEEISIYKGIDGCIEYIQKLTKCDKPTAIQIINEHEELKPSGETPEHYEAKAIQVQSELLSEKRNISIECPYCHGKNTKKISTTSRVISTSLFGLGSKKLGKQFHCNQCGANF